jgi:phage N-6-adenine-methyltransferase
MGMAVHYSSETDLWATPQEFYNRLDAEFHFELDVCATPDNAKCSRYFTERENGLLQKWTGIVWMNPPYGREIGQWIQKAYESAQEGATVVCLIPSRTDTTWWHEYCMKGEIRFVRGRLKFGGVVDNAPFPSAVVIFRDTPYDNRQLTIF